MQIGVLGSGVVGQTLGTGFAARGHQVMMGTRDPAGEKVTAWRESAGAGASVGTFADTAAFAELAVLATSWTGTEQALQLAGAERLAGKVLIDVTNPLDFSHGAPPGLALGHTDSGGEQVQRWLPGARVVKALNIIGAPYMVDPSFAEGAPDMFICGNDDPAKAEVTGILEAFGWRDHITDIGGIEGARLLEPLCILWVVYGMRTGGWNHAFKLVKN
ncbi:MAG TPA: NAD(P)-binding domain-containing protein [Actinomycetota bacterium]|nr:NAD(P)-binding domain-containing protein [Actinomycetota bacterium]